MKRYAFVTSIAIAIALAATPLRNSLAATPAPPATPLPTATGTAAPDDVAAVGPLHGDWTIDGKPAVSGEPIVARATLAFADRGAPGSIAIYEFDGRLLEIKCPGDLACTTPLVLDPLGDTSQTKSVMQDATRALPHRRFVASVAAPNGASGATPVDAIAPLGSDGSVDFGEAMLGVAHGPYRLVLRPLDPHSRFAPSGDSIFKVVTWTGDAVSVAVGGVPEGLYSMQLFARDAPSRALGDYAWAAVIGPRHDVALAGFHRARDIAAKWDDPEAKQLFLRSYLYDAVFPPPTPAPRDPHRRRER